MSQHLAVGNGGLSNGVKREEIHQLFVKFGEVIDIVMKPDKSYSFVTMGSISDAEKACDTLNGHLCHCPDELAIPGITLYLFYVESVPGYEVPIHNSLPPGLKVIEDFVTEEYEAILLKCVDWETIDNNMSQGAQQCLKHRRVKHYGYEFIYGINNVDRNRPLQYNIPPCCNPLIKKMLELNVQLAPNQLTVNEYLPGQGIPAHIDTHSAFEDVIVSLSLGSQVVMDFKHTDGRHIPVLLPQRSLAVMTGESRYVWTHAITPRKSDVVSEDQLKGKREVEGKLKTEEGGACSSSQTSKGSKLTLLRRNVRTSFTFRKLLNHPCNCVYKEQCDSQKATSNKPASDMTNPVIADNDGNSSSGKEKKVVPVTNTDAQKLEEEMVHQVYEEIASHFSDTRHSPWPKVVEFLNSHPPFSVILDVGCGNGKYLGANTQSYKIGCDRSVNLCKICDARNHPVFVSDCLSVPVRENSVDVVISIAVIHHLSTPKRRVSALQEIVKVLRLGGQALIYVWALEQELNKEKSNYLKESKIEQRQVFSNENQICSNAKNDIQKAESVSEPEESIKSKNGSDNIKENSEEKQFLPVHINRTPFVSQDLLVPWHLRDTQTKSNSEEIIYKDRKDTHRTDNSVYHRYYHVFKQGELEELCGSVKNINILKSYYDKGNWCVVLEKN